MTTADVLLAGRVAATVGTVYAGLPWLLKSAAPAGRWSWAGLAASLVLTAAAGTSALSPLGLVNPVTIVLLHMAWAAAAFVLAHRDPEAALHGVVKILAGQWPAARVAVPRLRAASISLGALLALVAAIRVWPALAEARLHDEEAYAQLQAIRQVLAGTHGMAALSLAWATSVTVLAGADAADVMRFLPALIGCAMPCAIAYAVWQGRDRDAGAVATGAWVLASSAAASFLPWGEALTRQHTVAGEWLAAGCLLLACSVTEPLWLLVAAIAFAPVMALPAASALVVPRHRRVDALILSWTAMCVAAVGLGPAPAAMGMAATVPVPLALLAGRLYWMSRHLAPVPRPALARSGALALVMCGVSVAPPVKPTEHESMARQELRVVHQVPGAGITVVADAAPLLAGARGIRLEPLAALTRCPSAEGCLSPSLDTVILIDKQPSVTATTRAQMQALLAADQLARSRPGAHVAYDDEEVRVYVVPAGS